MATPSPSKTLGQLGGAMIVLIVLFWYAGFLTGQAYQASRAPF